MTTYWLIGEKSASNACPSSSTVQQPVTTVTTITPIPTTVELPRDDRTSLSPNRLDPVAQSKTNPSQQNCQDQNHRAGQKCHQEQQRSTQPSQQQKTQQQVPCRQQVQASQREGGSMQNRKGGSNDGSGGDEGGGGNNGGGGTFATGNGVASRGRTIASGSFVDGSPSRNRSSVGSASSNVISQGRRSYQAGESVPNHTESGPNAPLLVPTTPPSRV